MVKRIILAWLLLMPPCFGALAITSVTHNHLDTDGTSFTTASVSPTANALVLLFIVSEDYSDAPESPSSITGTNWANGLTWTLENTPLDVDHSYQSGTGRHVVYSATVPGSVTAGTVTATFSATHEKYMWWLVEVTDSTTPAVVQTKTGTAIGVATASMALDTAPNASNGAIGFAAVTANRTLSWASLTASVFGEYAADNAPVYVYRGAFTTSSPPSTGEATQSASYQNIGGIYVEVGQPAASGSAVPSIIQQLYRK